MSLWKYRYFVDVVELKSFTRAGKKNFVSQTAISQQIADLEKKIGDKLIRRENGTLFWVQMQEMIDRYYKEEDFRFSKIDNASGSQLLQEYMIDIFIGYPANEDPLGMRKRILCK